MFPGICFIRLMLTANLGYNGVLFLKSRLSVTDWIFIEQLKRNMYTTSYSKLLENIVLEMSEPHNFIFNGDTSVDKVWAHLHSNSNVLEGNGCERRATIPIHMVKVCVTCLEMYSVIFLLLFI